MTHKKKLLKRSDSIDAHELGDGTNNNLVHLRSPHSTLNPCPISNEGPISDHFLILLNRAIDGWMVWIND
jgi:hypothetical protein